jgi:asparagine synthase (glutamine-hydrolysing)
VCGIAGIFARAASAPEVDKDELLRIRDAMWRRGPDDSGLWLSADRRVGLAHRRLAIIDLTETGAQPMASADGTLHITFNGEIYNYRELRADLEAKGHQFRSTSDTEVLLHLYGEHGPGMVEHLRGMFAFGIWDERKQGLFLARDPFGIKPLYFADDGNTIRFASQVKALLQGDGIDVERCPAGLVGFCLWGSVPEPYTVYRGIRALTSGTMMWVERDKAPVRRRHYSITAELARPRQEPPISRDEMREQLAEALADSVRHHLVADVPVGVFLSSGLDSATIAGLVRQAGLARVSSLTLGFSEYANTQDDEVPLAKRGADHYGMEHHTDLVSRRDFEEELNRIREAMDQPSIDGVNTYFVSRAASRAGMKVALSGLGGDELFGGYPGFSQIPRLVDALSPWRSFTGAGRAFRFVSAPVLKHFTSPKYAGVLEYGASYGGAYMLRRGLFMPWELTDLFDAEFVKAGWDALQPIARLDRKTGRIASPRAKVAAMEMCMYMRNQLLRDSDWAGMAWSVEIRTPLVDKELFRTVLPWMGSAVSPGKADMAAAPRKALPPEILGRKKTGFSIPVSTWLGPAGEGRGLRGWARTLIDDRIAAL